MNTVTISNRGLDAKMNPHGSDKGVGGQVDWSRVGADFYSVGKFTVKLAEAVSIGETAIDVEALAQALKKGTDLDFGLVDTVIVTFAAATINATSVTVTALTGAIPSGTILKTADSQEFVKLTADAALGATTLTVEAIPNALEGGETATYFGGRKILTLSADADKGATSITVYPPEFAIADDSEAISVGREFQGQGRMIPRNTCIARTAAGKIIPRTDAVSETAVEFTVDDLYEFSDVQAKNGGGTWARGGFWENLLPDAGTNGASTGDLPSAWKTELGNNFYFQDWADSRAVA